MSAQAWIGSFFALLAIVYGGLASRAVWGGHRRTNPARRTYRRIAVIFALVSLFLFASLSR